MKTLSFACVLCASLAAAAPARGGDDAGEAAVLQALSRSRRTLLDGVRLAAKPPAAAISAKLEDEGHGVVLSVYVAEKGLGVDAEDNVLQEVMADPTADAWEPRTETFEDVRHVARSAEQLTLVRAAKFSLADAIAKVQAVPGATTLSAIPVLREGRAVYAMRVAVASEVVSVELDVATGDLVGGVWPRPLRVPEPTPLVGGVLPEPVVGRGRWIGLTPTALSEATRDHVVLVATNSYLCEGTDEAWAWPQLKAWVEELGPRGLEVRLVLGDAETPEAVETFVRERKVPYAVLHDPTGANAAAWGLGRIGSAVLLGADGKVVWQGRIGPQGDPAACEAAIRGEIARRAKAGAPR